MKNKYSILLTIAILLFSIVAFSLPMSDANGIRPYTSPSFNISPNMHTIWSYTPSAFGNVNYTAAGDMFNDGYMGFVAWNSINTSAYKIAGISYSGRVMWNITIPYFVNLTIFGKVGSYSQTILVQSGNIIGPGTSVLALYNAYNGNLIWMDNISLSSGQSVTVITTGINIPADYGNATLLFLSSNRTSSYSSSLLIFNNVISLVNPSDGAQSWTISYTTYGESKESMLSSLFINLIPSIPGLTQGGFVYSEMYPSISLSGIVVNSYIVSYDMNDNLLFNITPPTANATTATILTGISVGNYLGGSTYYIATTLFDAYFSGASIKSEYGALAVLSTSGSIVRTYVYHNGTLPVIVQSLAYRFFNQLYKVPPTTPIGKLIDYTGGSIPDIVLENITIPSNIASMNAYLSVLDVQTNKFLWNSSFSFTPTADLVEQLSFSFNGASIPDILLIPATTGNITALSGSNGAILWNITLSGFLYGQPYNMIAQFYPSLMNLTSSGITSFITLSSTYTSGSVNLNVYSASTGKLQYSVPIAISIIPNYAFVYPLGEAYNNSYMDLGVEFISQNSTGSQYSFYGIAGNNGSYIFNGSASFSAKGYGIYYESGYVWNLFYPGLNDGQVTKDGRIDDVFFSTGNSIVAYNVNPYIVPSKLSVSLKAIPTTGYAPLTVNFTASVSGGASPYKYTWYPLGNGTSGAIGNNTYSYTYLSNGSYYAEINVSDSLSNYVLAYIHIVVSTKQSNTTSTNFYMVSGSVENSTGNTILATIKVINLNNNNIVNSTSTNNSGYFSFYQKNGNYEIEIYSVGYQTGYVNITVNNKSVNLGPVILKNVPNTPPANTTTKASTSSASSYLMAVIIIVVVIAVVMVLLYVFLRKKR
ncbi:MAG: PKD domain-containing protein [Thermoplasmata archaeon]